MSEQNAPHPPPNEQEKATDENPPDSDTSETEVTELSPEEQMALYEESLKEGDWGHQPC